MSGETRAESRCRYVVRKIAAKRGWNTKHPQSGGDILEEQEISDYFRGIGLGLDKPDFVFCLKDYPEVVVEAKNDPKKIEDAVKEAIEYAEIINKAGKFHVSIAVGAAGEEDHGYVFRPMCLTKGLWVPLSANGIELTGFPSVAEVEGALLTKNGTTEVTVPEVSEFITTAIEMSRLLRRAKIEPSVRPKVLGAVITALYWGDIETEPGREIQSINRLVKGAIASTDHFSEEKKRQLIDSLRLTPADFDRLAPEVVRIVHLLKGLNIKSVMRSGTDFLGIFYEAFIRYGYDNNALGIVFTPRHITRFCAELLSIDARDKVVDIACGSGGFLVASFDLMMDSSQMLGIPANTIRESLYGFDTNPTVWALASLNMFFRGDGKSHIENRSCFDAISRESVAGKFSKALLNPPFSQDEEPERDFINAAMDALQTGGRLAVVVKSGIFADDDNAAWRYDFLRHHSVKAMISLPGDLFYPTAVDTTIMVAEAGRPQQGDDGVFIAKVWNDGYRKLKGKRVEATGSQLPEVLSKFKSFLSGRSVKSQLVTVVPASRLMVRGAEFSPEKYLPQPMTNPSDLASEQAAVVNSILKAAFCVDDVATEVLTDFPSFGDLPSLPYGESGTLIDFFYVGNGKSSGESNYIAGTCPYISSGDPQNSIVRQVEDVEQEVFENGAITVTCFGYAAVQPWRFMARGNGGSSVRVLIPRYKMSFAELVWFAAQINLQRWRFFYGRMAIKRRLVEVEVVAPDHQIVEGESISEKLERVSSFMTMLKSK